MPKPKEDAIGRWSEEKLDLLGNYLQAYSIIMNKQKSRWLRAYHYIDAFAGSGKPKSKDKDRFIEGLLGLGKPRAKAEDRYIDGSPLKALQTEPPFDFYWFMEISPWRIGKLQQLQGQFPQRRMEIKRGDCNAILRQEIIPQVSLASKQRGLVFLDPKGLEVEWETIRALAQARTFDIFVNFSVMGITRLLKRDEPPSEKVRSIINRVMGTDGWVQEIYRTARLTPFFGEPPIRRRVMQSEWLARLYANQMSKLFEFVSEPLIMTNTRNAPLYALFLASHNATAVKIMNDIFNRSLRRLRELGK